MTNERTGAASEEAFALLGHEIRLAILRAFFERYSPIDPDSNTDVREQRTLSYAELMTATGMEDSGKFNYHLEKLRGIYVEEIEEGYVPTASAIALYEAVIANRPTKSIRANFDIDESCPNCTSRLRGKYEQEFLTVECPECDLFWGATYRFPKNGLAVREGAEIYNALYDRMMHHVGLARSGQCPSCAGITNGTIPRERLNERSTPTAELTCESCSWFVTVDIVSALQFEPQVTNALFELGLPLDDSSSMRATERVLPNVTGRVSSDDPFHATVSIPYDDAVVEITIDDELEVRSVAIEEDHVGGGEN